MDAEDLIYFPFSPEEASVVLGLAKHGRGPEDAVIVERSAFNELRPNRLFSFSNFYDLLKAMYVATGLEDDQRLNDALDTVAFALSYEFDRITVDNIEEVALYIIRAMGHLLTYSDDIAMPANCDGVGSRRPFCQAVTFALAIFVGRMSGTFRPQFAEFRQATVGQTEPA
ncbi:hypothetical protein GTA62_19550 [Roseobacter sp. HKCCD9010]|uniref:hypothetical protein n=1 Tax=unclassified Roseobacter TaxID=196798 RepID=UPI00149136B3|nr:MULTISPECIES: hypothetical protein [unclassified Roseobacter]MBF9052219.1 hypothetical protein [Rhodobacterales bacterium HKCCD4356]NNV14301.1 hypothetical protein [Roseobacter sp. HKCCD7357]NNV18339.1 hypothetical protein [Roseobacter sp. HKCCD8768]NNV27934.1 hypothetical protein [Roseobacter sp. HKCCD8192]NNV32113.1 hypothetical protein [Roseobacter sp. HKCCD9061]